MRALGPFAKSLMQIVLFWGVTATLLWLSPSRAALFPAFLAAMFLFLAAWINRTETLLNFLMKRLNWIRFFLFFFALSFFLVRELSEIWSFVVLATLLVLFESLAQKLQGATHD